MSRIRINARSRALRLSAVMVAILASAAIAQSQPETTVFLILRTGPDETEKGILDSLKEGIRISGAQITGEPTIKTVSPAFLEEFESLVNRANNTPVVGVKEGASIGLLPSRDTVYEVKLEPTQILKQLSVKYKKAGDKVYLPAAPGKKSPLVLTVPGRYAFTPEPNDTPLSYTCDIVELGKDDSQMKGNWPKSDKSFIVTMRNFRGDRKLLFDTIQDGKKVANPLKNVRLGNDLLFAFASLNSDAAIRRRWKVGADSQLTMTIETLPERNPRRVWVYFPLNEKEMNETLKSYRKFEGAELSSEIRKKAAAVDAKVGPTTAPAWFELLPPPPIVDGVPPAEFVRKIKLENLPQLSQNFPRVWMLVVWEFDDGGTKSAIKVKDPKDEPVFVLEQELEDWKRDLLSIPAPTPSPPQK